MSARLFHAALRHAAVVLLFASTIEARIVGQESPLPPPLPSPRSQNAVSATDLEKSIERLTKQIAKLAQQIDRITHHEQLLLDLFQLQLEEVRVERLEDRADVLAKKLKEIQENRTQIQYRIANAGVEVTLRGALRRDTAERELRDALQKDLRAVQQQEDEAQDKLAEAKSELGKAQLSLQALRQRIELLRGNASEDSGKEP